MSVYKAINKVQADLCKTGITKDSENTFDHYKFRGIDSVYNALSPLLAEHGLCIIPRMLSRTSEERQSQKGGALFYVTVEAEFDFVCAEDGSKHTAKTFGEAMDRGDKATNKAMSAAYKYACFQTLCIPTEAQDADAESHEVTPQGLSPSLMNDWLLNIHDANEAELTALGREIATTAMSQDNKAELRAAYSARMTYLRANV